MEHLLVAIAAIVALGIGGQLVAWVLRVPAIVVLLVTGIVAGPVTGLLEPDELFGRGLFPLVSLAVGLILFEGGLSLSLRELRHADDRRVLGRLLTVGVVITWGVLSLGAVALGVDPGAAAVLGAILVVTGPTVIGPLVQYVRPEQRLGGLLRWEGVLVDPVGAVLAVLVFEAVLEGEAQGALSAVLGGLAATIGSGLLCGLVGAAVVIVMLRWRVVPDFLENTAALAVVLLAFAVADELREESGLLAVTIMGVVLASRSRTETGRVLEFSEDVRTLLLSSLFIVLAARLDFGALRDIGPGVALGFLAITVLVARPLAVAASTVRGGLSLRQRGFLAWMAPRGIVAAAVSAVFAIRFEEEGIADGDVLAPLAFVVILGTIVLYGLTAKPVAKALGVVAPPATGVLVVGGNRVAFEVASALHRNKVPVTLLDDQRSTIRAARMAGLDAVQGNPLTDDTLGRLDPDSFGSVLALTSNEALNLLVCHAYGRIVGEQRTFQPGAPQEVSGRANWLLARSRGRDLTGRGTQYEAIARRLANGGTVRATKLTDQYGLAEASAADPSMLPLFVVTRSGQVLPSRNGSTASEQGALLVSVRGGAADPAVSTASADAP